MRRPTRFGVLLSALASLTVLLGACSGGDDDPAAIQTADQPTPTTPPTAGQAPAVTQPAPRPTDDTPPATDASPPSTPATSATGPSSVSDNPSPQDRIFLDITGRIRAGVPASLSLASLRSSGIADPSRAPQRVVLAGPGATRIVVGLIVTQFAGDTGFRWSFADPVTLPTAGAWHVTAVRAHGDEVDLGQLQVEPAPALLQPFPTAPVSALLHRIAVFNADGSDAHIVWDAEPTDVAWLRDSDTGVERIVFSQRIDGQTWIVAGDPDTGTVTPLLPTNSPMARTAQLLPSPNGRTLAVLEHDRDINRLHLRLTALDAPAPATIDTADLSGRSRGVWSPTSDLLALVTTNSETPARITLITADGRIQDSFTTDHRNASPAIVWAPNGASLLIVPSIGDGSLVHVTVETGDR